MTQSERTRKGNARDPCKTRGKDGWLRAFPKAGRLGLDEGLPEDEELGSLRKLFQTGGASATYVAPPPTSGKWMLFVAGAHAKACWDLVRDATETGSLGIGAKVAREDAARTHPRTATGLEHLVCVYTSDWRDLDDVLRVLVKLRDLGAANLNAAPALFYKPDVFTYFDYRGAIYRAERAYDRLFPHVGLNQWASSRLGRPLSGWEGTAAEAAHVQLRLDRR